MALLALLARPVLACAVCSPNDEGSRMAFLGTTIFLSLLPLVMFGAILLWIRRRYAGPPAADHSAASEPLSTV